MSQISAIAIESKDVVRAPKMGNPAVVGLAGFGLTTLMLQFHNLGFITIGPIIWLGLIFGGLAQMIAGFQEQKMGNNFGYSAFTAYGCFWISLCAILIAKNYNLFPVTKTDVGWFLVAWTLYTAVLLVASIKISKAMFLTFVTLTVGFIFLDLEHFGFGDYFTILAGWDLIACAGLAWYMMAHVIYLDLFGRDVLPVGKPFA